MTRPAAYCVNHPVTGAAMVFIDKVRAVERAASLRTHVTDLYTANQVAVILNHMLAANGGLTVRDLVAAVDAL